MKNIYVVFLLLFLSFASTHAQQNIAPQEKIEQLKKRINTLEGRAKLKAINELSKWMVAEGQTVEAKRFIDNALDMARMSEDFKDEEARALDNRGLLYQAKLDYTNAMKVFLSALKIREEIGDQKGIGYSKNNIGRLFYLQENTESALTNLEEAFKILQKSNDNIAAAQVAKNIGDTYLLKKIYGKAKQHYTEAMELKRDAEDFAGAANIASFLGNILSEIGDHDSALMYHNMSLDLNSSIENMPAIASDFNNMVAVYLAQGDYEGALDANETALGIRSQLEDKIALAETHKNFGVIYAKMNNKNTAEKYLVSSADLLKANANAPKAQDIYKDIASAYQGLGLYRQAYKMHVAYSYTRDVFYNQEKTKALLDLTTKYESEFEAEKNRTEIESLKEKESLNQRINFFLYGIIGLAILTLGILYYSYKQKKQDNQLLQAKNDQISKQGDEIQEKNELLNEKNDSLNNLNQKLIDEMAERESIEQSSFARDRFLATMSHEMRTPMNIIIGLTHLLLEEKPRQDQIEHLRTLQFSANNLVVFINDVLDFSKIEAGKLTLESREFSPQATIEDTKQRFLLPARDKNIDLTYNYDTKIPHRLVGDPVRLNQIITNLVSNAIKYTESGSVNVDVKLHELNAKDMTLMMEIQDTGEGMTEQQLQQMFRELGNNKSGDIFEGYSGLGLTITKRLVDLQNGKIEVKSDAGKGTTFTIYLPYKISNNDKPVEVKKKAKGLKSFEHLKGNKVLVVEDNKINQLVVAKMLKKVGIEVVTADDGLEALEAFEHSYFDLVLMDIQMPNMDGYRATSEIRKSTDPRKRDVPIIALTASAFLTEKEKAKLFGMNDHVGKPFGPEDLMDKITNLLEAYKTIK